MDKFATFIDIAQEDGAQNPAASFSRLKAKTTGALVNRSTAGVESTVGGNVSAQAFMLASNFVLTTVAPTEVPALTVTIPPGKKARIVAFPVIQFATTVASTTPAYFLRVKNPTGANGTVQFSFSYKSFSTGAAVATQFFDGDSATVAAAGQSDLAGFPGAAGAQTAGNFNGGVIRINLINNSTNTSATAVVTLRPGAANDFGPIGTSIFAIIT